MDEFIDSDRDMMVGCDPIWMTTSEYTVFDTIERVGFGILEPFKEEVGVVGRLFVASTLFDMEMTYLSFVTGCHDSNRPIGRHSTGGHSIEFLEFNTKSSSASSSDQLLRKSFACARITSCPSAHINIEDG